MYGGVMELPARTVVFAERIEFPGPMDIILYRCITDQPIVGFDVIHLTDDLMQYVLVLAPGAVDCLHCSDVVLKVGSRPMI